MVEGANVVESRNQKVQQKTVAKLKIQILSCFLNVKVAKPYVVVTLGDQKYQTSTSEFREGCWNESFEFSVTFHVQLFGTIQLDLYDNYLIYPDKHVGRAEIRLNTLETMPETFTSYYELWDKTLSTGASSSVKRKKARVNNVGALQAEITYQYLKSCNVIDDGYHLGKIKEIRTAPPGSTDLLSEEQLAAEFKRHLQFQRQRKKSKKGITSTNSSEIEEEASTSYNLDHYDEEIEDDVTQPLNLQKIDSNYYSESEEEFGEMIDAFSPNEESQSVYDEIPTNDLQAKLKTKVIQEDDDPDDEINNKTLLETVGSWAGTSETTRVIRIIGKLLATFGQGFELSNLQILTGLSVLEKFYADLPRDRSWELVENLADIDDAARFWKFSIASYGWKGLNFIGEGNGILSDAMREHSDAKSVIEYLTIPKEDLLAYKFRSAEAFRPSYFIAKDRFTNSIVLSIRGTMSVMDTLTDLVCEYEPWKGGFIHSGMKTSAMWFFRHVAPQLIAYSNEHSATGLVIVGHSLGAATAAILTIILTDYIDEFRQERNSEFNLRCYGYAPACGLSLGLAEKYSDIIKSFVFADDIVSKLSYGSMMDVKELLIASTEAVRDMGMGEIWSGDPEGEKWQAAFGQIAEVRKKALNLMENPRLYVAGEIFQFWLDPTPSNDTRIVIEKTSGKKVCSEVVLKKSILLDHLPTNFDLSFRRAREAIMLKGGSSDKKQSHSPEGVLDPGSSEHKSNAGEQNEAEPIFRENANHSISDTAAEIGLKGTTSRTGGDGKLLDNDNAR